ncbi:achaete-scute homolog 1b-like [Nilaparvata lugens]|uniref:achaete-scute homolog 1b-like n=1 Tax=Nilaparvata lugens TaxID=108931 RepID=UPI00193CB360|nr:achaete-scute homolog 1b-like [Nilaparvata lugens]XP_039295139.1 achaete-scute homolog 1b-like [Nilaparvata lugens]
MKSHLDEIWKNENELERGEEGVAKRNARERRRVEAVNYAFTRLRRLIPLETRGKRVSKVKTLQKAIEYIAELQHLLQLEMETEAGCHEGYCDKYYFNRYNAG